MSEKEMIQVDKKKVVMVLIMFGLATSMLDDLLVSSTMEDLAIFLDNEASVQYSKMTEEGIKEGIKLVS